MERLREELTNAGLNVDDITLDGGIHRCKVGESKDNRGWYVGIANDIGIFCTYGDWGTGLKYKYKDIKSIRKINREEINQFKSLVNTKKKEQEINFEQAAKKAFDDIQSFKKADRAHPYLINKTVKSHELLQSNNELIMPIFNMDNKITSYQRIFSDGSKKMMFNGQKKGCFGVINGDDKEAIGICEGWATGASINEATGMKVIVAIDVHNLLPVIQIVKKKARNTRAYLFADNDHEKKVNIGLDTCKKIIELHTDIILKIPPNIKGISDFNDIHVKKGMPYLQDLLSEECVQSIILNEKDLGDKKCIHMILPDDIIYDGGLIEYGMRSCQNIPFVPDIPQYTFPVVLSLIANSIAGKIQFEGGVWPNFYNVKVGGTSTGKSDSDKFFKEKIKEANLQGFYGVTDFASGPGLLRGLAENPQCLVTIDEISFLFKRFDKADALSTGKISALLECHTNAGLEIRKSYGNAKDSFSINAPCLNLIGNATPNIFDDIRPEDFTSGLVQRFDFWAYDGKIPYRLTSTNTTKYIDAFIDGMYALYNINQYAPRGGNLSFMQNGAAEIHPDAPTRKLLNDYSRSVIDTCNTETGASSIGIISRKYIDAIKNAMCHMASTRVAAEIYKDMTIKDLEWGIKLAEIKADWKLQKLQNKISYGSFHRDGEIFLDAIASCIKAKRSPTGKSLVNRKPEIKQWSPKHFDDVVRSLTARKEIIKDDTKKSTRYFLIKNLD